MTTDPQTPVSEMEGRELDAAVAEEVMGARESWQENYEDEPEYWLVNWGGGERYGQDHIEDLPAYSTDISAAWEVWEAICGPRFVSLHHWPRNDEYALRINGDVAGKADTAPLAICRAALKTVRE